MTVLHRVLNRIHRDVKALELSARRRMGGAEVVRDYGWVRLPFSGDGDLQEVYYHLNCEAWHEKEHSALAPYVRPGDTVVDVGANIGFMAALFHELVGEEGRVYAFEPSPRVFRKLERVIEVNNLSTVRPVNAGCGREPSTETLYQVSDSSGNASLVPIEGQRRPDGSEGVRLVCLDDFMRSRGERVDVLKIDTEGYESVVLEGAQEILERDRPVVYIELSQDYEGSSRESIRMLRERGYRFEPEPDLAHAHNGDNYLAIHAHSPRA